MACRILILAEHEDGALRETTFELLGMAHRLAGDAGWPPSGIKAVLIGQGLGDLAGSASARGAAEVICVEGEAVKDYTCDGYTGTTQGAVRTVPAGVGADQLRARFVGIKKGEGGAVDLTQAAVIVSGGRGVGAPEKFGVIRELAQVLGGQVGASRPVTDMGWLPHEHQVGSSGVTVNPKLYIACGISGAIQHIVGMKGAGYIIAINKDPDAPIFSVADVGVVGDLFEIVPALTKAVKEAKGRA